MPAGSPFHSAMITRNFGLGPNPSRRRSVSVQETAFGARSYSANSRMNDNISGISLDAALRSFNIGRCSSEHQSYVRLIDWAADLRIIGSVRVSTIGPVF